MFYLAFNVLGLPVPQGSKNVFRGHLVDTNAPKLRPWRADIRATAAESMGEDPPHPEAVRVHATFHFPRPRSHYGTGRNAAVVKKTAPTAVAVRPDLDKLTRALLDALTGVAWRDDSQVVALNVAKVYTAERPHVAVVVTEAEPWG